MKEVSRLFCQLQGEESEGGVQAVLSVTGRGE